MSNSRCFRFRAEKELLDVDDDVLWAPGTCVELFVVLSSRFSSSIVPFGEADAMSGLLGDDFCSSVD